MNTTAYCGAVERACLALNVPVLSLSDNVVHTNFTTMATASVLMEERINQKNTNLLITVMNVSTSLFYNVPGLYGLLLRYNIQ